jgi:endonuclease/exonuclease/phosphatase family metal-dependent hydrolase
MCPARITTFATYNVHGCLGMDRTRDPERVARVIRSLDASVVALQEVDCRRASADGRSQLDVLSEPTGMHAVSGPTIRQEDGLFFGNALLTRYPVLDVEHFDVSFRRREPRAILAATLDIAGAPVRCFVTHFGLSSSERQHQVTLLLKHLGDAPAVLMGDFNEWRGRAGTLRRLDRAFGHVQSPRSFPALFPLLTLDRVWVRPRAALCSIHAVRQGSARVASDHLPVSARIDTARLGLE